MTAVEIGRDGSRTTFHRRSTKAWTHPVGDLHLMDYEDHRLQGAPVRKRCPVCQPAQRRAEPPHAPAEGVNREAAA